MVAASILLDLMEDPQDTWAVIDVGPTLFSLVRLCTLADRSQTPESEDAGCWELHCTGIYSLASYAV